MKILRTTRTASLLLLLAPLCAAQGATLTLAGLEQRALAENPNLKALRYEAEAARRSAQAASALADPRIKLGLNNLPLPDLSFSRDAMTSKEIGISQMIPLNAGPWIRGEIARLGYLEKREEYRRMRLETIAMVRGEFYMLAYLREARQLLDENRRSVRLLIDSQIAAQKGGMGSVAGVIKANLEYSMIDEELIMLGQEEDAAMRELAYLAGGNLDGPIDTTNALGTIPPRPDPEELEREIVAGNPDIAMALLEQRMSFSDVAMQKNEYAPELELGFSYMQRDNGSGPMGKREDMVSFMASFNVPAWFWWKNKPLVEGANRRALAARQSLADKRNEIVKKGEIMIGNLKKWGKLVSLYETQLVPQSRLAFETSLVQYKTGRAEYMSIIDSLRVLLKYRKEALNARREYLAEKARLDAIAGREL